MAKNPVNFRRPISDDIECISTSVMGSLTLRVSCTPLLHIEVTGYQVIIQFSDPNDVKSLFEVCVKDGDFSGPVLMPVDRSGVYFVTVFAIRGGRGIVGSNASFYMELLVSEGSTSPTTNKYLIPGSLCKINTKLS